jgi:hypothetical protein
MKILRAIWDDLRQGENIDLYATIVVALIVSILNLLNNLALKDSLPAITLAILALLAVTNLVNRHKLDKAIRRENSLQRFVDEFPPSVVSDINRSKELWLVGIVLGRTLDNYRGIIKTKLSNNQRVNVILPDPNSGVVKYFGLSYGNTNPEIIRRRILNSLEILAEFSGNVGKNAGKLQVRIVDVPIPFGTYSMDIDSANGVMYVELYTFNSDIAQPHFVLNSEDGKWFELYREQLKSLWKSGKPYEI